MTRSVIGLAPSAAAAAVLREEINTDTDTLAKLIWHITGRDGTPPAWIDTIGPRTLVVIDGPRFSTRAESQWYAAQGWTLIGMTGHPEAVLARELAICYTPLALVTGRGLRTRRCSTSLMISVPIRNALSSSLATSSFASTTLRRISSAMSAG